MGPQVGSLLLVTLTFHERLGGEADTLAVLWEIASSIILGLRQCVFLGISTGMLVISERLLFKENEIVGGLVGLQMMLVLGERCLLKILQDEMILRLRWWPLLERDAVRYYISTSLLRFRLRLLRAQSADVHIWADISLLFPLDLNLDQILVGRLVVAVVNGVDHTRRRILVRSLWKVGGVRNRVLGLPNDLRDFLFIVICLLIDS